jgi:hypothetical protein
MTLIEMEINQSFELNILAHDAIKIGTGFLASYNAKP